MLIDTHCHIHYSKAFPDPKAAVDRAFKAGIERLIVVGTDMDDAEKAIEFAEKFENVRAIVGVHPTHADRYNPSQLPRLNDMLQHPKVLGLGEIGLDFHWKDVSADVQYPALYDQLDLAQEIGVPVIFHAREATTEVIKVLENRPKNKYLFHCFSGSADDALRATELDSYFGVDGPLTYPKAEELRDLVKTLPLDRIVVETDSPYLAPARFRGKPNEPAYVRYVAEELARLFGKSIVEIEKITTDNAVKFFGDRLL